MALARKPGGRSKAVTAAVRPRADAGTLRHAANEQPSLRVTGVCRADYILKFVVTFLGS